MTILKLYEVFLASAFAPIFGSNLALSLMIGFALSTSALFFKASYNIKFQDTFEN